MSQTSLWQTNQQNNNFAEICNALYERELRVLAKVESGTMQSMQGRLKSLPYYINRTANLMTQVNELGISPLTLDVQNASWSTKQAAKLSLSGQTEQDIYSWYLSGKLTLGLVVPIFDGEHVILDSIDRVDTENKRLRTNASGWFALSLNDNSTTKTTIKLLKPNKKIMLAACAGHCWQNAGNNTKLRPLILSLRELLLSCAINWKDFKQPLAL
jgi:hypothetical protein